MQLAGLLMLNRRGFVRSLSQLGLGSAGAAAILGASEAFAAGKAKSKAARKGLSSARAGGALQASETLSRLLMPVCNDRHLPGFIGAVMRGDTIAEIGVTGIRKIGSTSAMTIDDVVHLGSDTKAMTATMIATLVEEEKLAWTSTVADVFPERVGEIHRDFQSATLWDLLTHRAGLPRDLPRGWFDRNNSLTEQRANMAVRMLADAPASKPGTKLLYSNAGYLIAGAMAEQIASQPWETLMRERLFQPLDMGTAGFGPPGAPGTVDQPWGHRFRKDQLEPTQGDNPPILGPAATVHCSLLDWSKFIALHMRGAQGKPRLLKAASFRKLQTPPKGFDYAGGWFVAERSWAGGPALMHSGSNTMWYATVWIAPLRNFAIMVATNAGGDSARDACDEAVGVLLKNYLTG